MPSFIQYAFAAEGAINVGVFAASMLVPGRLLSGLVSGAVPDSTIAIFKHFGATTLGLSIPMFMSVPDSTDAVVMRKLIYTSCSAIEISLLSVLLWQLRRPENSGFTSSGLISLIVQVVPTLILHLYVLLRKPQWFDSAEAQSRKGSKDK